jgi:DNA-binding response OmpR family regulator
VARILIVEDELPIGLGLEEDLRRQGHDAEIAGDGETALRRGRAERWDLILLDVMLPKLDGFEVCRELRRAGVRTPILMLTARIQEAEKVMGLDMGADDYLTKPFGIHELRARVRALLRRAGDGLRGVHRAGDCELDFDRAEARLAGNASELTAQEIRLLSVFLANRGCVLSRSRLIELAWGNGTHVSDRVIDTHVLNLRKKIEPDPSEPRHLVGVRGLGYRFDP